MSSKRGGVRITEHMRESAIRDVYERGVPVDDIARAFNMSEKKVRSLARSRGWEVGTPGQISVDTHKIAANREANFLLFERLRETLNGLLNDFGQGKLKIERVFPSKGVILRTEVAAGLDELTKIAQMAKIVSEGSAAALGDIPSLQRTAASAGFSGGGPIPVSIVMPSALVPDVEGADKPVVSPEVGSVAELSQSPAEVRPLSPPATPFDESIEERVLPSPNAVPVGDSKSVGETNPVHGTEESGAAGLSEGVEDGKPPVLDRPEVLPRPVN